MPIVSNAIKTFLSNMPHNSVEMANWYHAGMEVQILAAADGAEPVAGKRNIWSNGLIEWGHIRLPKNADTEPIDNDFELRWPLHEHVDHIGMTGWDYKQKKSIHVGFDFDSIINHAAGVGITDEELARVKTAVEQIPAAWLFKSTSGKGLHLYLLFDPDNAPSTQNHHEHAALARACLGALSHLVNYPFEAALDSCGGNMWIWSRKMTKLNGGLSLLKQGEGFFEPPPHWQDHVAVIQRTRSKIKIQGLDDATEEEVETVAASRRIIPLDARHRQIIAELQKLSYSTFWVQDHNLLQTHTKALEEVYNVFKNNGDPLEGMFKTLSDGNDPGKPNCFCFPCLNGVFKVIRFGTNTTEDAGWCTDSKGWTYCYLNRKLELSQAAEIFGGVESASRGGGFTFPTAEDALETIHALGSSFTIPNQLVGKITTLKTHKDGRVILEIQHKSEEEIPGFIHAQNRYTRILNVRPQSLENIDDESSKIELSQMDQIIRTLLTINYEEAGWALFDEELNRWGYYKKDNIRSALKAKEIESTEVEKMLGLSVLKSWTLVNIPFAPEYPGNRRWNMKAAQFRYTPQPDCDDLDNMHPHWNLILDHCGEDLNEAVKNTQWAKDCGISTGREYLLYWIACLFRYPFDPLPYLFFFGPQNSGKSIFHEALATLVKNQVGIVPADHALISQSGFNGELSNAFLCVVEETDLSKAKSAAYNRIKDWVTSQTIAIHAKGVQVYKQPNTTHWVQCANERNYCPIFPGDTRITMSFVAPLLNEIPKNHLIALLENEAPFFMATIMNLKLPEINSRLRIPALMTSHKEQAAAINRNSLETFLQTVCYESPGEFILWAEFLDIFYETIGMAERIEWPEKKIMTVMPIQFPIGSVNKKLAVGNLSLQPQLEPSTCKFTLQDMQLVKMPYVLN